MGHRVAGRDPSHQAVLSTNVLEAKEHDFGRIGWGRGGRSGVIRSGPPNGYKRRVAPNVRCALELIPPCMSLSVVRRRRRSSLPVRTFSLLGENISLSSWLPLFPSRFPRIVLISILLASHPVSGNHAEQGRVRDLGRVSREGLTDSVLPVADSFSFVSRAWGHAMPTSHNKPSDQFLSTRFSSASFHRSA